MAVAMIWIKGRHAGQHLNSGPGGSPDQGPSRNRSRVRQDGVTAIERRVDGICVRWLCGRPVPPVSSSSWRSVVFDKLFKRKSIYRFSDSRDTACLVCGHVLQENAPVLYVTHDQEDGLWQFLCGAEDHGSDQARIISLGQAVDLDPSLNELHAMPLGFGATRDSRKAKWQPFRLTPQTGS